MNHIAPLEKVKEWSPCNWKSYTTLQQPTYSNLDEVFEQKEKLKSLPPLVEYHEIEELRSHLVDCENGKQFLFQMGDCAEMFADCTAEIIDDKMSFINEIAEVLENYIQKPVVKVGRIAGQYAKPRSSEYETVDGESVLSYKGDMINGMDKNLREPNPKRLTEAYFHAATTLNYMRIHELYMAKIKKTGELSPKTNNSNSSQKNIVSPKKEEVDSNLNKSGSTTEIASTTKVYASHEGMLLDYEECFTRRAENNQIYDLSGHFLWIGERTRNPDNGHVNFFKDVRNPLGMKVGNLNSPENFLEVFRKLNPSNEKGKLAVILRLGSKNVEKILPKIVELKNKHSLNFLWVCDPMHGNTVSEGGVKTRNYETVLTEFILTSKVLRENGEYLGGVHLEGTPHHVTECVGGKTNKLESSHLKMNYTTMCDPRLNRHQCMDLAKEIKEHIDYYK